MEKAPEGSYIPGMGLYDLTGDGQPDIAFVRNKAEADNIPEEDRKKVTLYTLEGHTIGFDRGR